MTTAPFSVTIRPRPSAVIPVSPYGVVMLIPAESGMSAVVNEITQIIDSTVDTQLGAITNLGRRWYEHLESKSNINMAVIPFDATDPENEGPMALAALQNPTERNKLSFSPDILLLPQSPGLITTSSAILTRAEACLPRPQHSLPCDHRCLQSGGRDSRDSGSRLLPGLETTPALTFWPLGTMPRWMALLNLAQWLQRPISVRTPVCTALVAIPSTSVLRSPG